jgi:MoaA/NifB/PqqE/SkfB family radical SAM enzyme
MRKIVTGILKNMARATVGVGDNRRLFDPVFATLYVTPLCNLRCDYCELFGTQRNAAFKDQGEVLDLDRLERVIEVIAADCQVLYITGGEPTLRNDLVQLLAHARERGIHYLAMSSNGLLIDRFPEVLDHLDNLVISVDSLKKGRRDSILAGRPDQVQRLLDNVRWAASLQRERGFVLTLTCVVTPDLVHEAREVMELCFSIGAEFSIQHLTEERVRSPALMRDPAFPTFIDEMIAAKRAGKAISGSELYLRTLRDRLPFACTPTVIPHIDWLGRLSYPCRELRDHIEVDLLEAGSIRAAQAEGLRRYGPPPEACCSCPDRCYVEMSSLTRHPAVMVRESAGYLIQKAMIQRGP